MIVPGRLAGLQQKLNLAGEGSAAASQPDEEQDPDTLRRISDLHKYSERAGSVLTQVPELVDRLEALSPLHTQVYFTYLLLGAMNPVLHVEG
jgi:hypothetical protein